jgi:hypothetical protein
LGFTGLLLSLSFVLTNAATTVVGNIIFLFVEHPFDVGDTLLVKGYEYRLRVDEVTLNYTCFTSMNRRIWYPNIVLQTLLFQNLTTSESFIDIISGIYVDIDTDSKILEVIKMEVGVEIENRPGEFADVCYVSFGEPGPLCKAEITVMYRMAHKAEDQLRYLKCRSWILEAVSRALVKMNVQYTWPSSVPAESEEGVADSPQTTSYLRLRRATEARKSE